MNEYKKILSFSDLIVWKKGHNLVLLVYKYTEDFPKREWFGLADQIRRAVVSITSNIAEGFSRQSQKEKMQFFSIAKGSLTEVQNQILIAKDVGYLKEEQFNELSSLGCEVSKLLTLLLKSTRNLP
jgi:four helix bundle protein